MRSIQMTYDLAMALSRDAGNRSMRKAKKEEGNNNKGVSMTKLKRRDVADMSKEEIDAMFDEAIRTGGEVVFNLDIDCEPPKPPKASHRRSIRSEFRKSTLTRSRFQGRAGR